MARGTLRIYLGAAPGVGKTYAMLSEGQRRAQRGADIVVGYLETHDRPQTAEMLGDLELIPRRQVTYRESTFDEMDLDAILRRHPGVVLVDELAHTNVPGVRHTKRWEDVEELLAAGIDVISTVNVQHLQSLNDVVHRITGVAQRETVPDSFVRQADQIELVDMSPEALRRRMAHGNIYKAEKVDAALANYFRPGNLGALRELALLWVADRVEEALQGYLTQHGITEPWETRERVVVALTGQMGGDHVIRRAARLAGRVRGQLLGVHVASADGLSSNTGDRLERHRALIVELGGTYREIVGDDIAATLAAFAASEQATQVVFGASLRPRFSAMFHGSLAVQVQRRLPGVDVHIIAANPDAPDIPPPRHQQRRALSAIPRQRELMAWTLAIVGLPLLTALLVGLHRQLNLGSVLLVNLAYVLLIAAVGGLRPGVFASIAASLLTNWYHTPPRHTFTITDTDNIVALVVFVCVAVGVSTIVDRTARQRRDARRARADATAIARSTGSIIAAADPLPELVDQMRALFELDSAAVLERTPAGWIVATSSGNNPPGDPHEGVAIALDAKGDTQLVMRGRPISGDDLGVLRAFADQLSLGLEARQLRRDASKIETLSAANALRTALLQAVSHDLRTPLASIKAAVTGLMAGDVGFSAQDRRDLLDTIDMSADRLDRLIGNLLDMSRLQSGVTTARLVPTAMEEVVAAALTALAVPTDRVVVDVSERLPLVLTDAALLERSVANLVSNALAWSDDTGVRIEAAEVAGQVQLRVIDRGPGIPRDLRARMFEPFQRLGDRSNDTGAGLGLAIARGFVELTGGVIELDDTPGGGCTFTIIVPIAAEPTTEPSR